MNCDGKKLIRFHVSQKHRQNNFWFTKNLKIILTSRKELLIRNNNETSKVLSTLSQKSAVFSLPEVDTLSVISYRRFHLYACLRANVFTCSNGLLFFYIYFLHPE